MHTTITLDNASDDSCLLIEPLTSWGSSFCGLPLIETEAWLAASNLFDHQYLVDDFENRDCLLDFMPPDIVDDLDDLPDVTIDDDLDLEDAVSILSIDADVNNQGSEHSSFDSSQSIEIKNDRQRVVIAPSVILSKQKLRGSERNK